MANQVPPSTVSKVRGIFLSLYLERFYLDGNVDLVELFANFNNPKDVLTDDFDIKLIDDAWFDEAKNVEETKDIVKYFRGLKRANTNRRLKTFHSATHDAMLLRWVQLEKKEHGKNVWLITLDNSLVNVSCFEEGQNLGSNVLALDAILQWIYPLTGYDDKESDIAEVFSEAVKLQLLPQDSFFDAKDFIILANMDLSCRELPAEDVEACIRYFKTHASHLNPAKATDREKIAHEITRFFADPGRKYKLDLQRLEKEKVEDREEHTHTQ